MAEAFTVTPASSSATCREQSSEGVISGMKLLYVSHGFHGEDNLRPYI